MMQPRYFHLTILATGLQVIGIGAIVIGISILLPALTVLFVGLNGTVLMGMILNLLGGSGVIIN